MLAQWFIYEDAKRTVAKCYVDKSPHYGNYSDGHSRLNSKESIFFGRFCTKFVFNGIGDVKLKHTDKLSHFNLQNKRKLECIRRQKGT